MVVPPVVAPTRPPPAHWPHKPATPREALRGRPQRPAASVREPQIHSARSHGPRSLTPLGSARHARDEHTEHADIEEAAILSHLLDQYVEVRRPVSPQRVATPPRWTPPWIAKDSNLNADASGTTEVEELPENCPPKPLNPPSNAEEPMTSSPSVAKRPQLVARMLNELLPVTAPAAPSQASFKSDRDAQGAASRGRSARANHNRDGSVTIRREKSSYQQHGALPPLKAQREEDAGSPAVASGTQVQAFRAALARTYGSISRAFRALKVACSEGRTQITVSAAIAGSSHTPATGSTSAAHERLCSSEFEWCVITHLKYGDRVLANKLFAALDHRHLGYIGLWELAQPQPAKPGLLSLADLRRKLLDQHESLGRAFRELEDYMEFRQGTTFGDLAGHNSGGRSNRAVRLGEFIKAGEFFGLDAAQAKHVFGLIDVDKDGHLTIDEFLEALSNMPREVLLKDFRHRLLMKHASIPAAFKELAGTRKENVGLSQSDVIAAVGRLGILELEALELFRLCDTDRSGDVSIAELRDAVREVAPPIRLEEFWRRFAMEFPAVVAAATGYRESSDMTVAGSLLADFLPQSIREECSQQASPAGASCLTHLSPEAFDAIAARLDVSDQNAASLLADLHAASKALRRGSIAMQQEDAHHDAHNPEEQENDYFIEDFWEQLRLWLGVGAKAGVASEPLFVSNTPWAKRAGREVAADAQAQLRAFKAELVGLEGGHSPSFGKQRRGAVSGFFGGDKGALPPLAALKEKAPARQPKLPWCIRPAMTRSHEISMFTT
mmetsp:Transcript_11308/g.26006  ORF Transcript_11308/g.26006 Transcript_11308/m.26006 type:complete len:783 (+) Transcript_11308:69-2417(+)